MEIDKIIEIKSKLHKIIDTTEALHAIETLEYYDKNLLADPGEGLCKRKLSMMCFVAKLASGIDQTI